MFEKILVPWDGSASAEVVLDPVRAMLSPGGELRLLHVVPDEYWTRPESRGQSSVVDRVRVRLEELERGLSSSRVRACYEVRFGDPASEILRSVTEGRPDLVAMATHAKGGLERLILGSVTERVLRRSPAPLVVVPPSQGQGTFALRRVLVPLDGSPLAAEVLPLVGPLAREHGAEVVLLHVLHLPYAPTGLFPGGDGFPYTEAATGGRIAEPARATLERAGVRARVLEEEGWPAATILAVAEREEADLVAMTTHGRSGLSRWVFGSVAEGVIRHAHRPLLVMRTAGFTEGPEAGGPR